MGRQVQVRVNYYNDARFLLRVVEALERDSALPADWKKEAVFHLKTVAHMFLDRGGTTRVANGDDEG